VGCSAANDAYRRLEGATMGTYYRVLARCPDGSGTLPDAISAELAAVDAQMSTYRRDSELSRFNDGPVGDWFPVAPELAAVVEAALTISSQSQGAFDVTVGPLVNLWGFGPDGRVAARPSADQVARTLDRVGYAYLEARVAPPALRKLRPLYVDLSAIAKGHGVDRLGRLLEGRGCVDYLVDIGGEVRGHGLNERGQPWRIGVEVPDPTRLGGVQRLLTLRDAAVATSGDYRNYVDLDGERFSHTIDPRTGSPVHHGLASVTVVHTSAMWADGLATALNVLGPDAGYAMASAAGLPALFLIRDAGAFEERYTEAMQDYLEDGS
jgi:thiamine biosynthesis lipoprotein